MEYTSSVLQGLTLEPLMNLIHKNFFDRYVKHAIVKIDSDDS